MKHYVVFVHGIGEQKKGDYSDFGKRLRAAFEKESRKSGKSRPTGEAFMWDEVYWADITQPDEDKMKIRIGMGSRFRQLFIGSLGDVIAYSKLTNPPDKYSEVQKRFSEAITRFRHQMQQNPETQVSLTVIAHSLGSVIASDGIYDLTNKNAMHSNVPIDRFFSMGSPIALFGLRYGLKNFVHPISPKLWINFFYPQDLIAYQLKTLNSEYNSAVSEDISLLPGGTNFLTTILRRLLSVIPLVNVSSHSWYLTDQRVINKIAKSLVQ